MGGVQRRRSARLTTTTGSAPSSVAACSRANRRVRVGSPSQRARKEREIRQDAWVTDSSRYWFRAKRFGWGWSRPATWEGWVVTAIFLVAVVGGAALFHAERPVVFLAASSLCRGNGD